MHILNREVKRPNVEIEDQNYVYLLGDIFRTKTLSELVLCNRGRSNGDFSKCPSDPD